jgi:hypothetical protein
MGLQDKFETLGGALIVLLFPLLLCYIWFDYTIINKLIATDLTLIVLVWIIIGSIKMK